LVRVTGIDANLSRKALDQIVSGKSIAKMKRFGIFSETLPISPLVVIAGLIAAGLYPAILGPNYQNVLLQYSIYFMWITLAEGWNLVGGYAGLLNLGFGAFFVLGSAISSLALIQGYPVPVAMVFAGFAGATLAILLTPTFRLRSDYFAIATLVIPIVVQPLVSFAYGVNFRVPTNQILTATALYYTGLILAATTIIGIFFLLRSRVGIALRAIGDNETASSSLGINIVLYKSIALAISGFIASAAGCFFLLNLGTVSSTYFGDLTYSLFPIFMVIIGGIGTFEGPIVGSLIFSLIRYGAVTLFPGSTIDTPFFSLIIIIVAVLLPVGIAPSIRKLIVRILHN